MSDVKREIKFRAWDAEQKLMMLPKNGYDWDSFFIEMDGTIYNSYESGYYKDRIKQDISNRLTLMQFTGLHDKNGKEIYEGDVVFKFYGTRVIKKRLEGAKGVVKFGRFLLLKDEWDIEHWVTGWYMDFEDGSGSIPITEVFEVIGNIYSNL